MTYGLSKSKILSGRQCLKRLWLEVHQPELAEQTDAAAHVIQAGFEVHEVARSLFPEGTLIEYTGDLRAALEETQKALKCSPGTPVFEGTFEHAGVLVRSDLLFPGPAGARLVEVKSASEVKDYYIDDCAVQAWVLEVSGVLLKTVEVAVVNTSFVYPGGRDYHGLFRYQDATERVRALTNQVPKWAEECRDVLEGDVPPIVVGDQCANPYPCPFVGHCTPPGPEYPVTCLPNGRDLPKQLQAEGIFDIRDIPEGRLRKPDHERVRRVTVSGKAEVGAAVGALLRRIPYPRYYLDFETIQFAVPIWPGTRPYQQIPFQWSCHIEDGPGKLDHTWFLDTSGEPPMRAVAESLLNNLGQSGPIFMYSSYEKRIIRELAELYPDLASGLNALIERLVDLWLIVKRHYYHPSMKGSWSLKPVAAAISPEMSHANLDEVTDGQAAQRAYWEIIQTGTDQGRRDDLRRKLLDYCKLDTMAMVSITRFLEQVG